MKILAENGRNKHKQRLVRAECACGRIVESVIYNNIKNGRTKTCGHCSDPLPTKQALEVVPELAPQHERGSVAWFNDQIQSKERTALVAEVRVRNLQAQLEASEETNLDLIKKWTAETSHFDKLNEQIARLKTARDKAETAVPKTQKTAAELTRERIAALEAQA